MLQQSIAATQDGGLHQLFVGDPNGTRIELNYPAAEAKAAAE